MAMADLATSGDDTPVRLAEIAERQDISHSYLEQLFAKLRKAGVVSAVRGRGGGYQLARAASELTVAEIVLAVNEPLKATRCQGIAAGKGCTGKSERCITHDLWDELGRQVYLFLSGVSLADVVERHVLGRSQSPVPNFIELGAEASAS